MLVFSACKSSLRKDSGRLDRSRETQPPLGSVGTGIPAGRSTPPSDARFKILDLVKSQDRRFTDSCDLAQLQVQAGNVGQSGRGDASPLARRRSNALAAGRGRHGAESWRRSFLAYVGQHAAGQHPAVTNQGPHAFPLARKHAEERPAPDGPVRTPRRHASSCSAASSPTPSAATPADDPSARTDDTTAWTRTWPTAAEAGESATPTTPGRPLRSRSFRARAGTAAHPDARRQGAGRGRGNASAKRGRADDRRQPILDPCVLVGPCKREPQRDGQPETVCVAGLAFGLRRV